jgi:hypothetical protein
MCWLRRGDTCRKVPSRCVECDHLLVVDEVEYFYKGKAYCDDCYRAVKKLEVGQEKEDPTQ